MESLGQNWNIQDHISHPVSFLGGAIASCPDGRLGCEGPLSTAHSPSWFSSSQILSLIFTTCRFCNVFLHVVNCPDQKYLFGSSHQKICTAL